MLHLYIQVFYLLCIFPPFTPPTRGLTSLIPALSLLPLGPKGQGSPLQWNHLLYPWPISCRLSERRAEIPTVATYPPASPTQPLLPRFQRSKAGLGPQCEEPSMVLRYPAPPSSYSGWGGGGASQDLFQRLPKAMLPALAQIEVGCTCQVFSCVWLIWQCGDAALMDE